MVTLNNRATTTVIGDEGVRSMVVALLRHLITASTSFTFALEKRISAKAWLYFLGLTDWSENKYFSEHWLSENVENYTGHDC